MAGHSSDGRGAVQDGVVRDMGRTVRRFALDESGSTAMEYGLIASLVALALVTMLNSFSESLSGFFRNLANAIRPS